MSGVYTDLTLRDFSLDTNNLPLSNTPKLRNRFGRWWNRTHPYSRLPTNEPEPLRETSFEEAANPEETRIDISEEEINAGQAETSFSTGVEETVLELGEAATETTALLGGVTAGSATTGTAGALGTVAATAVGGAAIAGIGVGVKGLVDHVRNKGAVLPGTDFVGPGNPIDPKPARSETDQVAKEHDLGYDSLLNRARSEYITEEEFRREVQNLDDEAIHRFSEEYQKSGTWQAFVGKYGLKTKRLIEDVLGAPVYPQQSKKREY
nr:MAG: structural protein [Motacilla cinerea ambidensovirus]